MSELFSTSVMTALLQVIMIDLVLAGDNAIVIGLAAAGLPKEQRNKAILIGIGAATALRIAFATVTTQLLQIVTFPIGVHAPGRPFRFPGIIHAIPIVFTPERYV